MPPKGSKRVAPKPAKAKAGNGSKPSRSSTSPTSPKNAKNRVEKTRTSSNAGRKSTKAIAGRLTELQITPAPDQSTESGSDLEKPAVRCTVVEDSQIQNMLDQATKP